jgi:hypothetical protein
MSELLHRSWDATVAQAMELCGQSFDDPEMNHPNPARVAGGNRR